MVFEVKICKKMRLDFKIENHIGSFRNVIKDFPRKRNCINVDSSSHSF